MLFEAENEPCDVCPISVERSLLKPKLKVLIAKFAEEGRRAWKAYQDSLLDMKARLLPVGKK